MLIRSLFLFSCFMLSLPSHASMWQALDQSDSHEKLSQARSSVSTWSLLVEYVAEQLSDGQVIDLPVPTGELVSVELKQASVLPESLAKHYPDFTTFRLLDPETGVVLGSLEWLDGKLSAKVRMDGEDFLLEHESAEFEEQHNRYSTLSRQAYSQSQTHQCELGDYHSKDHSEKHAYEAHARSSLDLTSRMVTYRLAVSTTLEYTRFHGNNRASALAAIVKTVNRINEIFERDAGIRFELVAKNDQLIVTSDDVNPFSGRLDTMLVQNQGFVDQIIGADNYDIGHVFNISTGGLAFVHSACKTNNKAMGISGHISGKGDPFDVDFVAHEIAHQFGATHTFGGALGWCASSERNRYSAFEPGSGSSIMSYAGLCGSDNLQYRADPFFHVGSIRQMVSHRDRYVPQQCGQVVVSNNMPPEVDAGQDYVIPAGVAFELDGVATDAESDSLSYSWQQIDTGVVAPVNQDHGTNSLFRSYLASTSSKRVFPNMQVVLGKQIIKGETFPTTSRSLNFSLLVHDSAGATVADEVRVSTIANGETFSLTPVYEYPAEGSFTVEWLVANTDLPPIACSEVDLHLSLNDGSTFPYVLANRVPNNGRVDVQFPKHIGFVTKGRLKLSCSDSIFFAVSRLPFAVTDRTVIAPPSAANQIVVSQSTDESNSGGGAYSFSQFLMMLLVFYLRLRMFFMPAKVRTNKRKDKF